MTASLPYHESGKLLLFLQKFEKRECIDFKPSAVPSRCECGRKNSRHKSVDPETTVVGKWNLRSSTRAFPTDAYGVIEFQGDPQHALEASFIRLSFDTEPRLIMQLLEDVWGLERPKMVISVHGTFDDFHMQPKLARAFEKGLIKAAKTTGAWLITTGLNAGVVQYVSKALASARQVGKKNIVAIGIAPWGILQNADEFAAAGLNSTVSYHPRIHAVKGLFSTLNQMHSHFLLADNGTCGRYGAEMVLRRRFEEYLSVQRMATDQTKEIPIVSVIVDGGPVVLRRILDYLENEPPIPVVVIEGSGGMADMLAIIKKHMTESDNPYNEEFFYSCHSYIKRLFPHFNQGNINYVYAELKQCGWKHRQITAFKLGEGVQQDIDHAILTALLTRRSLHFSDQLSLVSTWKRADIARSDLFVRGHEWTAKDLEDAMMEALTDDRVDFVDVLLQYGCRMEKFLTVQRLEELYNTLKGPSNSNLRFLMKHVAKRPVGVRFTLQDVGVLTENLIGGSYVSPYTQPGFGAPNAKKIVFTRPFNDLLIWAVLMVRQEMAVCFWQRGEDALAKCLVAVTLYKACADEVSEYDTEQETTLSDNAKEFERLSVDLLGQCYLADDDKTLQLLTYELKNWTGQTCLGLAANAENIPFMAHTGCQTLLADLWHGGMRIRKQGLMRVLFCILFPPFIFVLIQFKTKAELVLQAHKGRERLVPNHHSGPIAAKGKQLTCCEKLKEFVTAPITTFWIWTLSYLTFLAAFARVVLLRLDLEMISISEYYVLIYMFTYGMELCRRAMISEPRKCGHKIGEFCSNYWQSGSIIALIIFVIAFGLRMTSDEDYVSVAGVLYACDVTFWFLRLLNVIEVNSVMGQFMIVIETMLVNTMYMVVILLVILWAYGVMRQAIMYPHLKNWSWTILRNVTYKTYFMWYGEVYADAIFECDDRERFSNATTSLSTDADFRWANSTPNDTTISSTCLAGHWVETLGFSAYLLLTNIILINLLIAMFNYIYTETMAISIQIWKFRRYHQVIEYEQKPFLPPPFVVFYHIYVFSKFIRRCCFKKCCPEAASDYALKLLLKDSDVEKLLDFEEQCMDEMAEAKVMNNFYTQNERLRRIMDRQEFMSIKLDDILSNYESTSAASDEIITKVVRIEGWLEKASTGRPVVLEEDELSNPLTGPLGRPLDGRSGIESIFGFTALDRLSAGGGDDDSECSTSESDSVLKPVVGRTRLYGHSEYTTVLDGFEMIVGGDETESGIVYDDETDYDETDEPDYVSMWRNMEL